MVAFSLLLICLLTTSYSWVVVKTIPKKYHASSPPMDRCGAGLVSILAESIGLDLSQLPALPFSSTPAPNFDAAMDMLRGKSQQWEPSSIFKGWYEIQHRINSAVKDIEHLLNTPAGKAYLINYIEQNSYTNNHNLTGFSEDGEEDDCDLKNSQQCATNDSRLDYDLMSMPDVLTGFLTSRLMSRSISEIFGNMQFRIKRQATSVTKFPLTISMDSPMKNLGTVTCGAADYSNITDFDSGWAECGLVSMIAAGLGCSEKTELKCGNAHKSPTPDWGNCEKFAASPDEPVSLKLVSASSAIVDGKVTPESLAIDGRVLYYMWMACLAHTSWSSTQGLCDKGANPVQLVPGWDRVLEVWSRQDGNSLLGKINAEAVPFCTLSRKGTHVVPYVYDPTNPNSKPTDKKKSADKKKSVDENSVDSRRNDLSDSDDIERGSDSCEFLITQRGTLDAFEWSLNFDAVQAPGPVGGVHRGYKVLTDSVLPILTQWLEENVWATGECSYEETTIHITGHSLGGGLAEVYAAHLVDRYADLGVKFELVTFAPSHGIDAVETERVRKHVNVRSVVGELDIIPEFPCNNNSGLSRCDSRTNMMFKGDGQDPPYGPHINPIVISVDEMAAKNPKFGQSNIFSVSAVAKLSGLSMSVQDVSVSAHVPSTMNVMGWHICSYSCWLSSNFCTEDSTLWHMCSF